MEICWEGKQMCQYPTHIYLFFFSVKFPRRMFIFVHTPSRFVWLVTWPHMIRGMVLPDHVRPGVKKQVGGYGAGTQWETGSCNCRLRLPTFLIVQYTELLQSWSRFWLVVGFQWVSNAIFLIFNHSSMGGWFPMVRISLRVFFLSLDIIGVLQSCGSVVWPERLVKISVCRRQDIDGPCGDLTAVPLTFRGPKEEPASCSELALASMRIHRTLWLFHGCLLWTEPSNRTYSYLLCYRANSIFFLWIGACFIAMIDSRWITASLKENVESIPWIDEFRES